MPASAAHRRRRGTPIVTRRLARATRIALAALAAMVFAATLTPPPVHLAPSASLTLLPNTPVIGVTHTQYSADGYSPGLLPAEQILRRIGGVQNQHIMGFGAGNPEPRPGVYDWSSLDARMSLIARTGGVPVITLCCAPDWMKGGISGRTNWSRLTVAPREAYFDEFAQLAAAVARRYPQVGSFLVWNELKGFYDTRDNRWNYEAYTRLYNKVYTALKAVNPRIRVGGPYVVMESFSSARRAGRHSEGSGPWGVVDQRSLDAVRYWLRNAKGADFVAVDARSGTRDRGMIVNDIKATDKFVAIDRWLKRQTSLPIWWAEVYPEVNPMYSPSSSPHRAAVAFYALVNMINSGAAVTLLWQPQQDNALHSVALWTDAKFRGGGQALPLVDALSWLQGELAARRPVSVWWNGNSTVARGRYGTLILDGRNGRSTYYRR